MPSLAIIGSGISGISAAWILQQDFDTTLFEAAPGIGGHTHTVRLSHGMEAGTPVDMGFIVMNLDTYPLLTRFLEELEVEIRSTAMSFAHDGTAYAYGTSNLATLFGEGRLRLRPDYWAFLVGILRLQRQLKRDLDRGRLSGLTVGDAIGRLAVPEFVVSHYLLPMTAAIWSSGTGAILRFPMESIARFLANHKLLQPTGQPVWRFLPGGSRTYLDAFRNRFSGSIEESTPVRAIRRQKDGVEIVLPSGAYRKFDKVLLACHADQALTLLSDADALEKRLLSPWRYSANRVVLHTDARFMPENRQIWSAWNSREGVGHRVSVTYWMNHLQKLETEEPLFVTLNPDRDPAPERIHAVRLFRHPVFDFPAISSQKRLPELQNRRHTLFAGAHFGYGFHEDGIRSAVAAARCLGRIW